MKVKNRDEMFQEWLTKIVKESGSWNAFEKCRQKHQKEEREKSGKPHAVCRVRSWRRAASDFSHLWDQDNFDNYRKAALDEARQARAARAVKKADPQESAPPVVVIEDGIEGDILGDVRWVYDNLARLIRKRRTGERYLDTKALKDAPSNGAVGIAQYAFNDQKAFFEKFVTKILPKDDGSKDAKTQGELEEELDPTFSDLKKYIKRMD